MEDSLAASEGCKKRYLSLGSCAQGILHWPACIITILLSLSLWSYAIAAAPLFLLLLLKCQQVSWWCDGETWVLVYLILSSLSLHINLFFSRSYSAQMASPTLLLERLLYTVRGKGTIKLWVSRATQGRRTPMWEALRKNHALLSREHYRIPVWLRVAQTLGFPQPLWSPGKVQGHLIAWLLNLKLEIL